MMTGRSSGFPEMLPVMHRLLGAQSPWGSAGRLGRLGSAEAAAFSGLRTTVRQGRRHSPEECNLRELQNPSNYNR